MISCKEYTVIQKDIIKNAVEKLSLDIIQIGDNSASNSYIKGKLADCKEVSIEARLHKYDISITQEELNSEVRNIAKYYNSGIIIQLPIPAHLNYKESLAQLEPWQDIDGLYYNYYNPCTAQGIIDYLLYNNIQLENKNVVIIGRGELVGKPLSKLMLEQNANVTICHSHTSKENIIEYCKNADIIVIAIGKAKWLNFNIQSNKHPNKIIIDVGINKDDNNKLCGDVDRSYLEQQGFFITPVPGGVGLLTRVALLKNLVKNYYMTIHNYTKLYCACCNNTNCDPFSKELLITCPNFKTLTDDNKTNIINYFNN